MTGPAESGTGDTPPGEQPGPGRSRAATWGDLERAQRASDEVRGAPSAEVTSTEDARQTKKDRTWNRILRLAYGVILLVLLTGQVAIADYVFYLYGQGNAWKIPTEAIGAWLGATVIEVIGVVVVIVRFLFSRDSSG